MLRAISGDPGSQDFAALCKVASQEKNIFVIHHLHLVHTEAAGLSPYGPLAAAKTRAGAAPRTGAGTRAREPGSCNRHPTTSF